MREEIDFNKIAAEFVSQNIEKYYATGKDILKGATDNIRLHLRNSYKEYLSCVAKRYSIGKSFFIREPAYLYSFYVPMCILNGKKRIENAVISQITSINQFAILTGSAGTGKSMMMRHLFLNSISSKIKIPIFLELRSLNQTQATLLELIQDILAANKFTLDNSYIEKAMKAGHFAFFFDGFDEVATAKRKNIANQIQKLAKYYDQNIIIVSSRPDPEFAGWQSFSLLEMAPLDLNQACTLIEGLPFDNEMKSKFLIDLKDSLFKKHKSFLSNPLLLSIMLLTYGQSADIPSKLSVFYNQAYEALFQRHDALKGAYQRDRASNLDILDFARVFAAFSIQTYDVSAHQFSESDALKYIEKSKSIVHFEFSASDFLKDALQAVCLLIEDGLQINFSHRSFQEYFAARFIAEANSHLQETLVNKYSRKRNIDNVLDLLYEMKPEIVEMLYIIPALTKLEQEFCIKRKLGIRHYIRMLKNDYSFLQITDDKLVGLALNKNHYVFDLVRFVLQHCGNLVQWPGYSKWDIKIGSAKNNCEPSHDIGKKEEYYIIRLGNLKDRNPIYHEIAVGNHLWSMQPIEYALKIKHVLIEKHKRMERSLDEIFTQQ